MSCEIRPGRIAGPGSGSGLAQGSSGPDSPVHRPELVEEFDSFDTQIEELLKSIVVLRDRLEGVLREEPETAASGSLEPNRMTAFGRRAQSFRMGVRRATELVGALIDRLEV